MKFEFELENPEDAENLWRLFRIEKSRWLVKVYDSKHDGMPETGIDSMIAQIHYLDELEAIVFSKPVEYTKIY